MGVADVTAQQEPTEPEALCTFHDPETGQQVAMLSIQRLGDGADGHIAQMVTTYGPDAIVTDVDLGSAPISGTAFTYNHRESGPTTSLGFGIPPYFFIVHVDDDLGGVDAAMAIADAVAARTLGH